MKIQRSAASGRGSQIMQSFATHSYVHGGEEELATVRQSARERDKAENGFCVALVLVSCSEICVLHSIRIATRITAVCNNYVWFGFSD